jgi:branched-chain amino acid aminotransferase
MTDRQYHVDGDLVPAGEASVPVSDRGFRYGDAAFETVRVYGGTLFRWDAHLDRLADTCEILSLDHGLAREDLRTRVEAVLDANGLADASVRLSITRGPDDGGIVPEEEIDPTVVVTCRPLPRGGRGSEPTWDGPATLQTVKTRRPPDRALHTPSLDGPVLPGVTRDVVLDLARSEGVPIRTGRYTPDDVRSADEVFITSSTREIRPVGTVDGIEIDDGPVTPLLSRLYDALVERECYATGSESDGGGGEPTQ